MNHAYDDGADLRALARLSLLAPDEAWERRVRERSHAALVRRSRPRSVLKARVAEIALIAAVGAYLASVAGEALRLVWLG